MKVICPVCGAAYNISRDRLPKPVSKGACRNCGIVLLVNRDTGDVEVEMPTESSPPTHPQGPIPSPAAIPAKKEGSRDRLGIGVLVAALIVLVLLGFFLIREVTQHPIQDPFGSVSKWFKDLEKYGTEILGDTKKRRRELQKQKRRIRRNPRRFRKRPESGERSLKSRESNIMFARSLPALKAGRI